MPASSPPFDRLAPLVSCLTIKGGPGYDEARKKAIWNARLQDARSPQAIVQCNSAAEVQAAIRFAAEHELRVGLRGSGHSYIAAPLQDGGLLLDCGGMDEIEVDPEGRTAWVGPGARGGALIEALAEHGLAFPVGHCATVAMGGYLLSGGMGWNSGAWGPACSHVRAIELVTANGEALRASKEENAELFWAAKGAGCGFFAAITSYHIDLMPQPVAAWLWTASYPAAAAPALRDWVNAAIRTADPSAEIMCLIGPDLHSGKPSVTLRAVAMGDTEEEAQGKIASFRSPPAGVPQSSDMEERALTFSDLPGLSAMPDGKRVAADQGWTDAPMGDVMAALHHLAEGPCPSSTINLVGPGGGGRMPGMQDEATQALGVGGGISAGIYAMWDDIEDDTRHLNWVREADAALTPFRSGRYVGEADLRAGQGRAEECFTPSAFQRIEKLRQQYDPRGMFAGFPRAD